MHLDTEGIGLMTKELDWCFANRFRTEANRVIETRTLFLKFPNDRSIHRSFLDAVHQLRAKYGRPQAVADQYYAYIGRDERGIEGIVGTGFPTSLHGRRVTVVKHLMASDLEAMRTVKQEAHDYRDSLGGLPMSLRRFVQAASLRDEDLDRIEQPESHRQGILTSIWIWIGQVGPHRDEMMLAVLDGERGVVEPLMSSDIVTARRLRTEAARARRAGQQLWLRQYDFAELVDEATIP